MANIDPRCYAHAFETYLIPRNAALTRSSPALERIPSNDSLFVKMGTPPCIVNIKSSAVNIPKGLLDARVEAPVEETAPARPLSTPPTITSPAGQTGDEWRKKYVATILSIDPKQFQQLCATSNPFNIYGFVLLNSTSIFAQMARRHTTDYSNSIDIFRVSTGAAPVIGYTEYDKDNIVFVLDPWGAAQTRGIIAGIPVSCARYVVDVILRIGFIVVRSAATKSNNGTSIAHYLVSKIARAQLTSEEIFDQIIEHTTCIH